ncbi:DUF5134 domain-containing protein [Blastococcus sp. KM273129]|uniref:DUF5134 domain-containing protein n=1 Tax=Blastococcus sp. KM273129 TaxID=2570315 RepID=UPI001F35A820|nr:DUF5134 domain-containing protein [Blastococcus sp. KM273129]MCF6734381.1 DUF5134 domain-containing protein [Blastococcus sp. KM273129]
MAPSTGDPLRWLWLGFFVLLLGAHLRHVRRVRGVQRLWYGGHALMAAAMAGMFLPAEVGVTWAPLWSIGAGGAAGGAAVYALLRHWDGVRVDVPWTTLVVGLAATAYMWLMMAGVSVAPLTYAAAAWLACEALGWFTGLLCWRSRVSTPPPAGRTAAERQHAGVRPSTVAPTVHPTRVDTTVPRPVLAGEQPAFAATRVDRLSLGLLALGTAYLFVAMQQMPAH